MYNFPPGVLDCVFHGFQVNFTRTSTCQFCLEVFFWRDVTFVLNSYIIWGCDICFVGSCYHVRILGCVRTFANKVQRLCDIWIGFNVTKWSIRVQLHTEQLCKGLLKEDILECQCVWGYFKQWKYRFKNKYPSQVKLKAVLSPGRNAVGRIDFRTKRPPKEPTLIW